MMLEKKFFILTVLLFTFIAARADETWNEGVVVLKDQTVINGDVQLNTEHNLVQVRSEGKIKTYTAFQVDLFYFHDTDLRALRKHISLPFEERGVYRDIFFEEIIRGEASLLRRAKMAYDDKTFYLEENRYTLNGHVVDNYRYHHAMSFNYYYRLDNMIVPAHKFANVFVDFLKMDLAEKLENFIVDNRLNIHKTYDQIQVVKFYNGMKEDEQPWFF